MRMVLMLAAVLIVSLLIFKGYSAVIGGSSSAAAEAMKLDPIGKARNVDPLVEQAAEAQRKAIEQQLQ